MSGSLSPQEAKKKGDEAYRSQQYQEALDLYTIAMTSDKPDWKVLLSNRSAAAAKTMNWQICVEDAIACIKDDASWPKGWYRLGTALLGLTWAPLAKAAFEIGLGFRWEDAPGPAPCDRHGRPDRASGTQERPRGVTRVTSGCSLAAARWT